jgi:hypothetical protein
VWLDLARDAEAEAADLARRDVGFLEHVLDAVDHVLQHRGRAAFGLCWVLDSRNEFELVVEEAGEDFRAAEIDADPVVAAHGSGSRGERRGCRIVIGLQRQLVQI